jgi:hypothetical protein
MVKSEPPPVTLISTVRESVAVTSTPLPENSRLEALPKTKEPV